MRPTRVRLTCAPPNQKQNWETQLRTVKGQRQVLAGDKWEPLIRTHQGSLTVQGYQFTRIAYCQTK